MLFLCPKFPVDPGSAEMPRPGAQPLGRVLFADCVTLGFTKPSPRCTVTVEVHWVVRNTLALNASVLR
jgi:hypothetical protein